MDFTEILIAASIPSTVVAFFVWMLERKIEKRHNEQEKREEARRKNEVILIESVNASIALGEATAKAVQRIPDANCNGDMHAALQYASEVKRKHREFITNQGIDALY